MLLADRIPLKEHQFIRGTRSIWVIPIAEVKRYEGVTRLDVADRGRNLDTTSS